MPDFRAYCASTAAESTELHLSPEESHHLVVVNRARKGDTVIAFDGKGTEWTCEVTHEHKRNAVLGIRSVQKATALPCRITLCQALPKGPTMDAIVRKATEIGASRIIPLSTERTQVHLDGERSDKKIEKWQTAALEAAKQCGNPWLPEIQAITPLAALLGSAETYDLKLIASLHAGAKSLRNVLSDYRSSHGRSPVEVLWMIGPEGDFTPNEMNACISAGFVPITLGPLVLRCETAATYALSVLSYELGC